MPVTYAKHAAAIAKAWPDFVRAGKARGVADPNTLWSDFMRAIFDQLEAKEQAAAREALKAIAPNALTPVQQKIATAMGLTPAQYLDTNASAHSPAAAQLTAAQLKIVKALGVTPEAFLAAPGERR